MIIFELKTDSKSGIKCIEQDAFFLLSNDFYMKSEALRNKNNARTTRDHFSSIFVHSTYIIHISYEFLFKLAEC